MSGRRWMRRVRWWALALPVVLVACGPKSTEDLSSARALSAMLQEAGATVQETAAPAPPAFDAQDAQALQVNEGLVYVYAYGSVDEAKTIAEGPAVSAKSLPWKGRVSVWQAGRLLVIYPGTDGGLLLLLSGLLGDPLTALAEGPEEPYPPAVAAAISSWAEAQGVDPASVGVVSYMAGEWLDGCLGLPGPGESCAPGPVRGWVVDLQAGDRLGSAHTDDLGLQVRLTSPE